MSPHDLAQTIQSSDHLIKTKHQRIKTWKIFYTCQEPSTNDLELGKFSRHLAQTYENLNNFSSLPGTQHKRLKGRKSSKGLSTNDGKPE